MFNKVLIANRGEIALRVIRACRSWASRRWPSTREADGSACTSRYADEAVCIGPPPAAQSYLEHGRASSGRRETGAEAIHPGYGFLAENAAFAELCREPGSCSSARRRSRSRLMGDKAAARATMTAAGVPVTARLATGIVDDAAEAEEIAAARSASR